MRAVLRLRYDGTGLSGFQRQPPLPTVQGRVEDALRACGVDAPLVGASRTDAGVHAEGQVAHVKLAAWDPGLKDALAAHLPPGIEVRDLVPAPPRFHARWSSRGKVYRYLVAVPEDLDAAARDPFLSTRAWVLPDPRAFPDDAGRPWADHFDVEAVREALRALLGTRDLRGLSTNRGDLSPARGVRRMGAGVVSAGPAPAGAGGLRLEIHVSGTAFLRHQVRNLVGLLAQVGAGRVDPRAVSEQVAARDRHHGPRAPGRGLTLVRVRYPAPVDPFR